MPPGSGRALFRGGEVDYYEPAEAMMLTFNPDLTHER